MVLKCDYCGKKMGVWIIGRTESGPIDGWSEEAVDRYMYYLRAAQLCPDCEKKVLSKCSKSFFNKEELKT